MPWTETDPYGRATAVRSRRAERPLHDDRALRPLRRQPADRLQMARPLRGGGPRGLDESEPRAAPLPAQDPDRARGAALRAPPAHPDWGARKLLDVLRPRHPSRRLARGEHRGRSARAARPGAPAPPPAPAPASRASCRRRPRRRTISGRPTSKGSSAPAIGVYCYPLTIADQHTRFLLTCHGLLSTQTRHGASPSSSAPSASTACRAAIRTDNGVPFATQAIHGLSYLNVWWMRLGIQHQRIHPGRPQENGAHERMHRTLKRQAIQPVQRTCARATAGLRCVPRGVQHRAAARTLEQETPASHYRASPRAVSRAAATARVSRRTSS